jgi:HAE1 family hydrophobic/amphiphilic exporter-1
MNLSEISIKKPVFAWMLMIAFVSFGFLSFQNMGVSQLPDVDFPVINIELSLQNAAPEIMESDVVDVIESAVMGIEGVRTVSSSVTQGKGQVTIEFELNRKIDVALQEVQTRIAQAQKRLPKKLDPPVITKINPEDKPLLWLILTGKNSVPLVKQMIYARNILKDRFSTVDGVGNILFAGYVEPNLRVWLDGNQMAIHQLTTDDILAAIQNEQIEIPAGRIENKKNELNLRVIGEADNVAAFGKLKISSRGGAPNYNPIPLSQVANIEEGLDDIRSISRYNGKRAVGLGIVKQRGANAVKVSELIRKRMYEVKKNLPPEFSLEICLDTTKYIKESVFELNFTLILSALLTSIVCFLFLGSVSSTFNVFVSIPTSIIGTFLFLYFLGFTLNIFTLLGLSLAVGIVVDDAIMMLENIVRHKEMGKTKFNAALDGSQEITFAAIAATIAIAAIFIPVVFMKGIIGKFFYQYGITVTVAVLISLLCALSFTPMQCSQFLQENSEKKRNILILKVDKIINFLSIKYKKYLEIVLNFKITVLFLCTIFFIVTIFIFNFIKKEFIPSQDQSLFLLTLKAPVGTSLTATDKIFLHAEKILKSYSEIEGVYSTIGNYQGQNIVNTGVIYVLLKDQKMRAFSQNELMEKTKNHLKKELPSISVYGQDLSLTGLSASQGYPIELTIQGPHWAELVQNALKMLTALEQLPALKDISTNYQADMPEIRLYPDREKAAQRGVSIASIGQVISTFIGGSVLDSISQYQKDGHRYDIRVRSKPEQHKEIKNLNNIFLRNNRGNSGDFIFVKNIVNIKEEKALQMISRINRQRAISIFANIHEQYSKNNLLQQIENIGKKTLQPGYTLSFTGNTQTFQESFEYLIFALILGIFVAYMVLGSQFNSFIHPIAVLMALPFSLSGALLALYFKNQSLNIFSMIGIILLMGIAKKNSILLVDFTNKQRLLKKNVQEALLEACPMRLRPILMTSLATVVGAIPAAFAFGPGAETRVPMAITLIGGVTISTFLTLFIVPCVYSLLTKLEKKPL